MPVKIFLCYIREDEPLLNKLKAHLSSLEREGLIRVWHGREISAGTEWEQEISKHLNEAQIILLLISPDFIASDRLYDVEVKRALERHEAREAKVIPLILRPTSWENTPIGKLQALPTNGKPVTTWSNFDEAFHNVEEGIRLLITEPPSIPYDPYSAAPPPPPLPLSQRRGNRLGLLVGTIVLLLVVGSAVLLRPGVQVGLSPTSSTNPTQTQATATVTSTLTATAQANASATTSVIAANPDPYPPRAGMLALYDPLSDNSKGYGWDVGTFPNGTCAFTGGAYHMRTPRIWFYHACTAEATDFSNFAFEAQAKILKGDCAGLIFRADTNSGKFYFFEVCQDGSYRFYLYMDYTGNHTKTLAGGTFSAITTGLNQSNVLAVVAQGSTLDVYVNEQRVASANESTYSHGQIALVSSAHSHPTEVAYSNVKVWTL